MPKTYYNQMSFIDLSMQSRVDTQDFLYQIEKALDWQAIEKILNQHYTKGSHDLGRKAYPSILLFKMSLLQTWYGLSDVAVEKQVRDRLSFMQFCHLSLDDNVPDHSVLSRFRTILTKKGTYDLLFQEIDSQLVKHGVIVKSGVSVDASITDSPRKPKGAKQHILTEDGHLTVQPSKAKGVDQEASWVKKSGKLRYGYKRHYTVDKDTGLVISCLTSTAKDHETKYLPKCLESTTGLKPRARVYTDKGYCSAANATYLSEQGYKNSISKKGVRGRPLSDRERQRNKLIGKTRYRVERVFGSIKSWFKSTACRYVGEAKAHTQHVMEAIAYNLYRLPRLIVSIDS